MENTTTIEPVKEIQQEVNANFQSKWYVLRLVSGKERKVKEILEKELIRNQWQSVIKQFFLPIEKIYKMQGGKKILKERNYFPGYIMVEIIGR